MSNLDHTWNAWEVRHEGGKAHLWERNSRTNLALPARWNKAHETFFAAHQRRQRVYSSRMGDWLGSDVPIAWFCRLLAQIRSTPNLDWLLVSSELGRIRERLEEAGAHAFQHRQDELHAWIVAWLEGREPLNVWLGARVCDQSQADEDIAQLLQIAAAKRLLFLDPLVGPIDLTSVAWPGKGGHRVDVLRGGYWNKEGVLACGPAAALGAPRGGFTNHSDMNSVDWVIVAGEIGTSARPMHPDWATFLRDQCMEAGVPFTFQHWGEWTPISQMTEGENDSLYRPRVRARAGQDQGALNDLYGRDCRVKSAVLHRDGAVLEITAPMAFLQGTGAMQVFRVGKSVAGRRLDGREWSDAP